MAVITVEQKIKQLIQAEWEKIGKDVKEIKSEDSISDDLGLDSLDIFSLEIAFEDAFGAYIDAGDWKSIKTFGDLVSYFEKNKKPELA